MGVSLVLVITSGLLIIEVLLHRGSGGGLTDMFGGGATQMAQGSAVAQRNLNYVTTVTAAIWCACIIASGLLVSAGSGAS